MGISKEGCQVKIQKILSWNFMDTFGTINDNDRIKCSIRYIVWQQRSTLPSVYFFSSATNGAMKAIRTNSGMIKKVYVPKYIYPLSSVLFNYIIFAISLIVLVVVSIVLKVYPTVYLLQAIIPLILLLITAFGVGMIRDLEYLWSVGLMIIMYASAIFYKPDRLLKSGFGWILKCNPLYLLIHNFRQAVFGMPMNMKFLAASVVFAIVSVIVGLVFFYKKQDEFILHI